MDPQKVHEMIFVGPLDQQMNWAELKQILASSNFIVTYEGSTAVPMSEKGSNVKRKLRTIDVQFLKVVIVTWFSQSIGLQMRLMDHTCCRKLQEGSAIESSKCWAVNL